MSPIEPHRSVERCSGVTALLLSLVSDDERAAGNEAPEEAADGEPFAFFCRCPATASNPERVLGRRFDRVAADTQGHDLGQLAVDFFDYMRLQNRFGIALVLGQDPIAFAPNGVRFGVLAAKQPMNLFASTPKISPFQAIPSVLPSS